MKKPNHSNDNEGQNYDPATGKYIADSDAGGNLVDKALLAPGLQGDFTEEFWNDFIAKANEGIEEKADGAEKSDLSEEHKKIADAMSAVLRTDEERKEFLSRLDSLPEKMQKAFKEAILGHDSVHTLGFIFSIPEKKLSSPAYRQGYHQVYIPSALMSKCGPALEYDVHNPWETMFHEIAHSVDATSKTKIVNNGKNPLSHNPKDKSDSLYAQAISDINAMGGIEKLTEATKNKINGIVKSEIAKSGSPKTAGDAIKLINKATGKMAPILDFLSAYKGGAHQFIDLGNWLCEDLKSRDIPVSFGEYIQLTNATAGHSNKYWNEYGRYEAGSEEMFAELSALMATDKEMYDAVASILPGVAKKFEGLFDYDREEENKGGKENGK